MIWPTRPVYLVAETAPLHLERDVPASSDGEKANVSTK